MHDYCFRTIQPFSYKRSNCLELPATTTHKYGNDSQADAWDKDIFSLTIIVCVCAVCVCVRFYNALCCAVKKEPMEKAIGALSSISQPLLRLMGYNNIPLGKGVDIFIVYHLPTIGFSNNINHINGSTFYFDDSLLTLKMCVSVVLLDIFWKAQCVNHAFYFLVLPQSPVQTCYSPIKHIEIPWGTSNINCRLWPCSKHPKPELQSPVCLADSREPCVYVWLWGSGTVNDLSRQPR